MEMRNLKTSSTLWAIASAVVVGMAIYLPSYAQRGWVANYETGDRLDRSIGMAVDADGSVYVSGKAGGRLITLKYSDNGSLMWQATYQRVTGPYAHRTRCMRTPDGVVVLGIEAENFDALVVKYSPSDGGQQWVSVYGREVDPKIETVVDVPRDMASDAEGNVYVVGDSEKEGDQREDLGGFVIKIRGIDGYRIGKTMLEAISPRCVALDNAESVYVAGHAFDNNSQVWRLTLMKYLHGQIEQPACWQSILTTNRYLSTYCSDIQVFGDAVYVLGRGTKLGGDEDVLLVKFQAGNGELLWVACVDTGVADIPRRLAVDSHGNIYLCANAGTDLICLKYSLDGEPIWQQPVRLRNTSAAAIAATSGVVFLAGQFADDHFVASVDAWGNLLWRQVYDGPPSSACGIDFAANVVAANDIVYVSGASSGAATTYQDQAATRFVTMRLAPMRITGRVNLDGFLHPARAWQDIQLSSPDSVETALGRVRVRVGPRLAFHDDEGRLSCVLPDCGVTEYYDVSLRAYKLPLVQGDPPCVTHWLRRGVYGVAVLGGALDLGTVQMTNGDCDGDNEITNLDFGLLVAAFGSMPGDSNWDTRADVDGDGEVTLGDFAILTRNFGAAGDDNWWEGDPCVF
jgi:hypothetical protein